MVTLTIGYRTPEGRRRRPGFLELWGRCIYHCPYCHGWEVHDMPLAVMVGGDEGAERAVLIRNWSRAGARLATV